MTSSRLRILLPAMLFLAGFLSSFCLWADEIRDANERQLYTIRLLPIDENRTLQFDGLRLRDRYGDRLLLEANDKAFSRLLDLGYDPQAVPRDPALPGEQSLKVDTFHKHEDVEAILADRALRYPNLVRLIHLGQSGEGRSIDMLKISDNPGQDEEEPELRVLGCHHGNELMSVEIPLVIIDTLLEGYGSDDRITSLVNDTELYIAPLVNPDGRERQRRENASDIDLNRNYGYQWHLTSGSSDQPFTESEVRSVVDQMLNRHYLMSLSFHTTAAYINYVWNYSPRDTPDEDLIYDLSEIYEGPTGYEVTNGYDWYQTYGDTNDFSYGSMGVLDWTIETDNEDIPAVTQMNLEATLDLFDEARGGIAGTVTDADNGAPLQALVIADPATWPVYSDPANGYFHRLVKPADEPQNLWVFANGYEPKIVSNVMPGALNATMTDVVLEPSEDQATYAMRVMAVTMHYRHTEVPWYSLGPADGEAFAMDQQGVLVLDLGQEVSLDDQSVLKIHCSREEGEQVKVYLSDSYWKDWAYIGDVSGTQDLDLSTLQGMNVRYVRLEDQGNASGTQTDGFDLDAVSLLLGEPSRPDGDEDGDVTDGDEPADGDEPFSCVENSCYRLTQVMSEGDATTATGPWTFLDESICLARIHVCAVPDNGVAYDLTLRYDSQEERWQGPTGCTFNAASEGEWESEGQGCGVDALVTSLSLRSVESSGCEDAVVCSDGMPTDDDDDTTRDDDDDDTSDDDDDSIRDDDDETVDDDDDNSGSAALVSQSSSGCAQQAVTSWLALGLLLLLGGLHRRRVMDSPR